MSSRLIEIGAFLQERPAVGTVTRADGLEMAHAGYQVIARTGYRSSGGPVPAAGPLVSSGSLRLAHRRSSLSSPPQPARSARPLGVRLGRRADRLDVGRVVVVAKDRVGP